MRSGAPTRRPFASPSPRASRSWPSVSSSVSRRPWPPREANIRGKSGALAGAAEYPENVSPHLQRTPADPFSSSVDLRHERAAQIRRSELHRCLRSSRPRLSQLGLAATRFLAVGHNLDGNRALRPRPGRRRETRGRPSPDHDEIVASPTRIDRRPLVRNRRHQYGGVVRVAVKQTKQVLQAVGHPVQSSHAAPCRSAHTFGYVLHPSVWLKARFGAVYDRALGQDSPVLHPGLRQEGDGIGAEIPPPSLGLAGRIEVMLAPSCVPGIAMRACRLAAVSR
jgi:hypothetical protein